MTTEAPWTPVHLDETRRRITYDLRVVWFLAPDVLILEGVDDGRRTTASLAEVQSWPIVLEAGDWTPSTNVWCHRCGVFYRANGLPQCECAGDPPVDRLSDDFSAWAARMLGLRYRQAS